MVMKRLLHESTTHEARFDMLDIVKTLVIDHNLILQTRPLLDLLAIASVPSKVVRFSRTST